MGRVHRRSDTDNAVKAIESVYGTEEANYSIDLISGVPGLTQALWVETLEQATALVPPPSHMSIYDLQIEKGTVFSTWYSQSLDLVSKFSPPSLPTENDCAFMYK